MSALAGRFRGLNSLLDHTHRFSDTCLPTGVQPKSEFALRCFLMHCGWRLLKWSSRDLTIFSDTHQSKLWLSCVSLIELHSFAQYANVFSRHNKNRITMEKREWWFCKKKKKKLRRNNTSHGLMVLFNMVPLFILCQFCLNDSND